MQGSSTSIRPAPKARAAPRKRRSIGTLRFPWRPLDESDDEDAPNEACRGDAPVEYVEDILVRASGLAAAGHRDRAQELLGDMRRAVADGGVQRLADLLVQVVDMERARHEQDLPFQGAPLASPLVGEPTSAPGSPREALRPPLPRDSPWAGGRASSLSGQPCGGGPGDGGAATDPERARLLCEELDVLRRHAHGEMGGPIASACLGAIALVEGTFELSYNVQRQLLAGEDRFVAPQRVAGRLRKVRRDASAAAAEHHLLGAQLGRLATEAELQEALLAAEYKANLLKGGDAFAEMARARGLLDSFLGAAPGRPSVPHSAVAMAADVPALAAHGQQPESQSTAPEGDRPRRVPSSGWDCPSPAVQRGKTWASGGAPSDGARLALAGRASVGSASTGAPHGAARESRLERWYVWFFEHCVGKLELLCHGGLAAAWRLGPDRVAGAQGPAGGAGRAAAGAEAPSDARCPRGARAQVPHDAARCAYLGELRALAGLPGVLFAGVFANAQQLPHLQGALDPPVGPGAATIAATIAPVESWLDSAWLFDPGGDRAHRSAPSRRGGSAGAGAGAAASDAGADYDWWALSFSAASSATPQGSAEARATSTTDGAEAAPPPLDGPAAYERWRHEPELRQLRLVLGRACQQRHLARGARDRADAAPMSDLPLPHRGANAPALAVPPLPLFPLQAAGADRTGIGAVPALPMRDSWSSLPPAAQKWDAAHERGARHGSMDAAAERHHDTATSPRRARPSMQQAFLPDLELPPATLSTFGELTACEALLHRPIDVPRSPLVQHLIEPAEAHRPFYCLVMPLDIGWFPAPLFLGVAARPPQPRSRVGTAASQSSSPTLDTRSAQPRPGACSGAQRRPPAPGDAQGAPVEHPAERECAWRRALRWLRAGPLGGLGPGALPGPLPPEEFSLAAVERELARLAADASGRRLRGGLAAGASLRGCPAA